MNKSETFELTLFPGNHREALLNLLATHSITNFVESAGEVNADDNDWESAFAEWSSRSDAPVIVYSSTRDEFLPLLESIRREFKGDIRTEEKFIADTLWQEAWEPGFEALETERFVIAAPEYPYSGEKVRIQLNAAPVFGSGQHATTQALVRLLEKQSSCDGKSFLDVGTGTGVLCFVAAALGFAEICGTDIEDSAIENSRENALINKLNMEWFLGSLPPVDKKWDVIVCNILPPTLTDLIVEMKARLNVGGRLFIAGFHEANSEAISSRVEELRLVVNEECVQRSWLAWELRDI